MRIAIVDDVRDEISFIERHLEEAGSLCDYFGTGEALTSALRRETYDAVLLDWNLDGASGLEILGWIQANVDVPPPVLIMTNRDSKTDVVEALEAGAVDFIGKPEEAIVVQARINAAVRQAAIPRALQFEAFAGFVFDDAARTVTVEGTPVELRQKEYALARLLFENINRPLSRGYILQRVWQCSPNVETRTLDVHVSKLRTVLGLRPDRGFMLQTMFGFGYRLIHCQAQSAHEALAS